MGLPNVRRWPLATVSGDEGEVVITFSGDQGARSLNIPLRSLGGVEDLESFELRLLAQLQSLGYDVRRAS
jgi:hypothetical protein